MSLRFCLSSLRRWFRSRPAPVTHRRRTPLRLEELEARDVPAVVPTDAFVASVYQGFLGRALDSFGQAFWRQQLNAGVTREQVAGQILQSPEYHGRELQILYQTYLGRPLDTLGLRFFGNILESGGTYEQVKAGILGSTEYFAHVGNTNSNFLTAVYQSQLGRNPGPVDQGFWLPRLGGTPTTRADAVAQILNSDEAHAIVVNSAYREILSRPLDSVGATFWVGQMRAGATIDPVLARIVGSPEFFNQLNLYLSFNAVNISDVNIAVQGFLNAGGKFVGTLPGLEQLNRNIITDQTIRTAVVTPSGTVIVAPNTGGGTGGTVVTPNTVNVAPTTTFGSGVSTIVPGSSTVLTGTAAPLTTGTSTFTPSSTLFSPFTTITPGATPMITTPGATPLITTPGATPMITTPGATPTFTPTTATSGFPANTFLTGLGSSFVMM